MSDLQICRICLIKDVRGYKMDQYHLRQCYEQIMSGKVNDREGLPIWFCYECSAMLHKFKTFKERCMKGQTKLRQMLWSWGITYDTVEIINRLSENLVSPFSIIMTNKRVRTYLFKHRTSSKKTFEEEKLLTSVDRLDTEFREETELKEAKLLEENEHDYGMDTAVPDTVDSDEDDNLLVSEQNLAKSIPFPLPFEEEKFFTSINSLDKELKEEELPEDDDQDNGIDIAVLDTVDSGEDDNLFLSEQKLTTSVPVLNNDIDLENIISAKMTNEVVAKPEPETPKPKNGRKPVNKGILITKTAADKSKAKKFEKKKRVMNQDHWKKIHMTEEEAMLEMKQRANSDKFLKANFKCHECYRGYSKLDMLMRHAKRYHDEAVGTFLCRFCHMRFPAKWALTKHMTEHYIMYECLRCDMRFREMSAPFHDDVHNGVVRKCKHCGKEFVHLNTYYTHIRDTHRSNHICTLCGASFVSAMGLRMHKKITHYEEKDTETPAASDAQEIYCEQCDIKFMSRRAYNEHLSNSNNHGDEKIKAKEVRLKQIPTTCTHCGQNFPSRQACKKHHLTDHRHIPFDKRDICEVCGVSVAAGSVAQHMVTHTGERPYPCTMCDKRFTQNCAIKRHYKTVHLKQPYPKYPRRKPYRRKKKTEEIPQNDFTAFIRPGFYS